MTDPNDPMAVTLYLKGGSRENCETVVALVSEILKGTEIELIGDWQITRGSWVAYCLAKAAEIIPVGLAEHCWGKVLGLFGGGKQTKQAVETVDTLTKALKEAGSAVLDLHSTLLVMERDAKDRPCLILHQITESDRLTLGRHPELKKEPQKLLAKLGEEGRVRFDLDNEPVAEFRYEADLQRTIQHANTLRKLVEAEQSEPEQGPESAPTRLAPGGAAL